MSLLNLIAFNDVLGFEVLRLTKELLR